MPPPRRCAARTGDRRSPPADSPRRRIFYFSEEDLLFVRDRPCRGPIAAGRVAGHAIVWIRQIIQERRSTSCVEPSIVVRDYHVADPNRGKSARRRDPEGEIARRDAVIHIHLRSGRASDCHETVVVGEGRAFTRGNPRPSFAPEAGQSIVVRTHSVEDCAGNATTRRLH